MVNIEDLFNDLMDLIGLKYYDKEESDEKYSVANHSHNEYLTEAPPLTISLVPKSSDNTGAMILDYQTLIPTEFVRNYDAPSSYILQRTDTSEGVGSKTVYYYKYSAPSGVLRETATTSVDGSFTVNIKKGFTFRGLRFDGDGEYSSCYSDEGYKLATQIIMNHTGSELEYYLQDENGNGLVGKTVTFNSESYTTTTNGYITSLSLVEEGSLFFEGDNQYFSTWYLVEAYETPL